MLVIPVFDFNVNRLCPTCGQAHGNTTASATPLLSSLLSESRGECEVRELLQMAPLALVPLLLSLLEARGGDEEGSDTRKGCAPQPFRLVEFIARTYGTPCCPCSALSLEIIR